ncbi:MAG: branched-chain amino acid ABC transporter permease, partial [Gaiellales bacterium]
MARIGTDEWVATVEGRTAVHGGWLGQLREAWERVHPGYQLAAFAIIAAIFPFLTDSDFVLRVGVNVLLFAILAVGLNVTVGWTGMLDLSFVAFYGFGAYAYAFMSSNQFDLHWPTEAVIIIAVIAAGFLGLLLGLPSWRLVGDYLAIITLFFAQMFVEIMNNLDRISVPWRDEPLSITGGPNGITRLDDFTLFGIDFSTLNHYFYFLLIALILVVVGFHGINQSRTGRAWRAIREDPLAAEAMSVPINRLRILAFTFGAATAGLAGSVFAAVQTGVFPQSFEVVLLIMIYAALVLGGTGSIKGAILGAIVIASIPQVLRPTAVDSASWLFYLALLGGLL